MCIPFLEQLSILKARPDEETLLRSCSKIFTGILLYLGITDVYPNAVEYNSYIERMKVSNACAANRIFFLMRNQINITETLLQHGCSPTIVTREEIEIVLRVINNHTSRRRVISKTTFDKLVAWGVRFEPDDFVIVDLFREPIFRDYHFLHLDKD